MIQEARLAKARDLLSNLFHQQHELEDNSDQNLAHGLKLERNAMFVFRANVLHFGYDKNLFHHF